MDNIGPLIVVGIVLLVFGFLMLMIRIDEEKKRLQQEERERRLINWTHKDVDHQETQEDWKRRKIREYYEGRS